jgi:hypothetical protein
LVSTANEKLNGSESSVDDKFAACDEAGVIRRKEQNTTGDIFFLSQSTNGMFLYQVFIELCLRIWITLDHAENHGCPNVARMY